MRGIYIGSLLCLFALFMVVGSASAAVNCQSLIAGDNISASTTFGQEIDDPDTCIYSDSAFSSRLSSRGGVYQSAISSSPNGIEQVTVASVNGMYRDSTFTLQLTGGCEEEICSDEGTCTKTVTPVIYAKSQVASSSAGIVNVQSASSIGSGGLSGQVYVTGKGTSSVSASALEMSKSSTDSFKQRINANGSDITAGMVFDWVR